MKRYYIKEIVKPMQKLEILQRGHFVEALTGGVDVAGNKIRCLRCGTRLLYNDQKHLHIQNPDEDEKMNSRVGE